MGVAVVLVTVETGGYAVDNRSRGGVKLQFTKCTAHTMHLTVIFGETAEAPVYVALASFVYKSWLANNLVIQLSPAARHMVNSHVVFWRTIQSNTC